MNTIEKLNEDFIIQQFNKVKIETFDELKMYINYFKQKINDINDPFLERSLYKIGLSARSINCIRHYNSWHKLFDNYTEEPKIKHILEINFIEFKKQRNVGPKVISEIESILQEYGYSFKNNIINKP